MHTPNRIPSANGEKFGRDPSELSPREREIYEGILIRAETAMAQLGTHAITFSAMAVGLRMYPSTLRRYFADLDVLLATLLRRHLHKIADALGEVPKDALDRAQKRRAAYLTYTRTSAGEFTEPHLLLVRDRHLLPEGLQANIEATRRDLGDVLAPGSAELALDLLDMRALDGPRIEAVLSAIGGLDAEPRSRDVARGAPGGEIRILFDLPDGAGPPTIH